MEAAAAPRATREEKDRLLRDFVRLCETPSPSRRERQVADLIAAELRAVGLEVEEDASASETGSDTGNLLARIPGPEGARTILLCAHMDTVPPAGPVEVANEEGVLTNRHDAILGADNKAAVAAILGTARRLAREGSPVGVELVFTTCEEVGLVGAKAFDTSRLSAEYGYVFDHASPLGELIIAAPTYYRIEARFHGHAAHAGIRPENGRNAIAAAARALDRMQLGRLDAETTANVGLISGGSARNVVAERCAVELEARSLDQQRIAAVVADMVDAITEAASDFDCDVETDVAELSRGYRLPRGSRPVAVACEALERLGVEPVLRSTGGGSDASVFQARGVPCVNVADGSERNHQPDERIAVEALERLLDLALGLVASSG
ncbi:MAG: M20/M25/M40 family metallo-hydrolase [Thermoleophilaceae bacterium]|nr:M20/M25/M40 family metallo-hydrolase [Thermoleophilaceae bacterium]